MQLDENYRTIIDAVQNVFKKIFGDTMTFVSKQVSVEHMGYFRIQYKYLPLQYDIVFENERNAFVIDIYDDEGAKNTLYRIEKYSSGLSTENVQDALQKLKKVLEMNDMCFYIRRNEKLYKKIGHEYKRVKDLKEITGR